MKMKSILLVSLFFVACIQVSFAPPVPPEKQDDSGLDNNLLLDLEYKRYLEEVVNALESDPDFKQKLEKADELDIQSGKIANELEFVSHHVRTRLDEIKRVELERLKELVEKKKHLENGIDKEGSHGHLDHQNSHTFEIEDLKKLIAKINEDLNKADERRKEQFKKYELEKEYEKQKKLNDTNGAEREKLEKEFKEKEEKHKKHEKLHQPIHKAQLEEVWEKQDQMQQNFDPKTFFMLHDIDGNGLWDQDEVKAILFKDIEKMYQAGSPEDDIVEAAEELERMRESVFKEVDLNRDGFIDYMEFSGLTKKSDFQQDNGWKGLDEQKPYTDEELAQYINHHQMQQMQQGYHPQGYPHQQVPPGYHNQPVYQQHPGQIPPLHVADLNTNEIHPGQGQPVQYQHNPNQPQYQQVPQYQQHPNQPQYQQHQNQPQYQQHPNQPQYQQHPAQVHPNAQYQQVPNQGQAPPNVQQQNMQYQQHQQGQPSQQQDQSSQQQSTPQDSQQKPQSPQSQSQNPQSQNVNPAQQGGNNAGAQQNQAFQQSQNNQQAGQGQPIQQNPPQVVRV